MIGKIIPKRATSSIAHLNDYILNRDGAGEAGHKVLFSGTFNMMGGEAGATWEMESVAARNTHVKHPVMHCLLSWRAGEQPTEAQAREAVMIALRELDLEGQQCVWALHQNTDNVHAHIAVNRIDLQTHRAINPAHGWTIRAMERAARKIEFAQGWEVERNAWSSVDENGMIQETPRVDAKQLERKVPQKVKDVENLTGEKSAIRYAKDKLAGFKPTSWQELHAKLAEHGMTYKPKGSGAVIFVGEQPIKASLAGKRFAMKELVKTVGAFEERDESSIASLITSPKPEPLSKKNDTETWREYREFRSTYYERKRSAHADLKELIDRERAELKERQSREREESFGGESWVGRGRELNIQRSLFKAKHAQERLELRERHATLRASYKQAFAKLPTYEEWLRDRSSHDDAEEWRYRVDDKAQRLYAIEPGVDGMTDDKEPRDLRGFVCKAGKTSIQFVDRSRGVVSFRDFGARISVYERDDSAMLASMQLGMAKWGSIKITGTNEYKLRCVALAIEHGIKITNPELQDEIAKKREAAKNVSLVRSDSRRATLRDQFAKYHEAVGADRYAVTATLISETGSKRGFVVNKRDGAPDGFNAEELDAKLPRLLSLQDDGRNIYLTPVSDEKHHILVDDLDHEDLARFMTDGYEPAAIIETSPNNLQAIITIPKLGTPHDREIANEIVRELNQKYGDPKVSGATHAHRAPGFENRKPKHIRYDGTFPETPLVKAERVVCQKTLARSKELAKKLAAREQKQQSRISDMNRLAPPDKASLPVMKAFAAQFRDVYAIQKSRETATGKSVDMSRLDSMVAVRLRATGHAKDDVRDAIETLSPCLRRELGMDDKAHNWHDYAARTAGYSFGKGGERSLAKFAKNVIDRWRSLEESDAPEARSVPLSIDEDRARLAELSKPRDEFAKAYAREKIIEADRAEAECKQKFLAAAQADLDKAQAAYDAHVESDAGITLLDKLWNKGKAAREKQAAYDEERGRLDLQVQHARKRAHSIQYGHLAFDEQEKRERRDDGFYYDGYLEYEKQHPDEAKEFAVLDELVRLHDELDKMRGVQNDKQIAEAKKIIEIETSRGMSQDEALLKHPKVKVVIERVVKTIEQSQIDQIQKKASRNDEWSR